MRLAVRMPLLVVGAVLVTGLAAASVAVIVGRASVLEAALAATGAGAEVYGRTVETYLAAAIGDLRTIAATEAVASRRIAALGGPPDRTTAGVRRELGAALARSSHFESLMLVTSDGMVGLVEPIDAQRSLSRPDVGFLPWFDALAGRGVVVSDLHISTTTRRPSIVIAVSVHDPAGRLSGYVVGALRLAELSALMASPAGDYFGYLTDSRGLVVAHGRNPRFAQEQSDFSSVPAVRLALSGASGSSDQYNPIEAEARIAGYRPLPELGWAVNYVLPRDVAFLPAQLMTETVVGTTSALILVLAAITFVVSRRSTAPIGQLALAASAIAAGDRSVDLPRGGSDEVGILSAEFRSMVDALAEREDELRVRAVQLEASNRELEAFSYTIAHDLRAPLRAIDGFGGILEQGAVDWGPESRRHLGIVRTSARKMGTMIDDLLEFARYNHGPLELRDDVDPAAVARRAFADLTQAAAGRDIRLNIAEMPSCRADPRLLERVYVQLLSNAIKFTSRTPGPTTIDVGARPVDGLTAYFVRDTGIGLDLAHAGELFGMFKRLVGDDEFEGTGVGLAIARRIVERFHGRIWVESTPGQGATFLFTLGGSNE